MSNDGPRKSPFHIRIDHDLTHPQVLELLREHLAGMHAESPPESVHALDLSGLRQGAAQAILTELLHLARQRRYARVSLETGSTPAFEPAIAMYRRSGFVDQRPGVRR